MASAHHSLPTTIREITALPLEWPLSGSLRPQVLETLARHASEGAVAHSAETGAGKSTLLLSQLSGHHIVFTRDDTGDGDSLPEVRASPLLRRQVVEFVVGPTQETLVAHRFAHPLDVVLIDGPHGFPFPHLEYYVLYPQLAPGALLVLDDVHIRSVNDVFRFLRDDPMFSLLEVVRTTAFFRRTEAPAFHPLGDGWWLQPYNLRIRPRLAGLPAAEALKALVPLSVKETLRGLRRRYVPIRGRGG
jgi:hypothetical protein